MALKESFRAAAKSAMVGYAVGYGFEPIITKFYAHYQESHNSLSLRRPLSTLAKYSLRAVGTNPRTLSELHLAHHREINRSPKNIPRAFGEVGGNLLFGERSENELPTNPATCRDTAIKALSVGASISAVAVVGKSMRSTHPISSSVGFVGGYAIGLARDVATTMYLEHRSGVTDGNFDISRVSKVWRKRLANHQNHHDTPQDPQEGMGRKESLYFKGMKKAKLLIA